MKNSQKGFVKLLVIVVVAILAVGGGIYFFTKVKNTEETNKQADISSGWKTYTSAMLGVEVKYPQNWQYHVYNDAKGYFSLGPDADTAIVTFQTSTDNSDVSDGVSVTIAGKNGLRKFSSQIGTVISVSKSDGTFLKIAGPYQDLSEFEGILTSVKLIESN